MDLLTDSVPSQKGGTGRPWHACLSIQSPLPSVICYILPSVCPSCTWPWEGPQYMWGDQGKGTPSAGMGKPLYTLDEGFQCGPKGATNSCQQALTHPDSARKPSELNGSSKLQHFSCQLSWELPGWAGVAWSHQGEILTAGHTLSCFVVKL